LLTRAKPQVASCPQCGQPIPPTGLHLPPIKQRIYEIVQRHPDITAEELRGLEWRCFARSAAQQAGGDFV